MENQNQGYAHDGPRIVAEQWGIKDGRAALDWVRGLPDETVHHQAAREAFRTWFESDRAAAVAWLESETLTIFHDPITIFYANELSYSTPAEGVGWCERIFNEGRRLACLKKMGAKWYLRDAVAAETWLQQSPLDEEARRAVRTPPEKRRQQRRGPAN
jgi:hypothetical protein